ncbi:hypothetical protein PIB30_076615, partial [Stylosanthes scabra]|nr:hypothetical protein [Stylosanthes scabra]
PHIKNPKNTTLLDTHSHSHFSVSLTQANDATRHSPTPSPTPLSQSHFRNTHSPSRPHRPVRPCQRRRGDNSPLHHPWLTDTQPCRTQDSWAASPLVAAPPWPCPVCPCITTTSPLRRPAVSRSLVAVNCSLFAAPTRPATSKSASL